MSGIKLSELDVTSLSVEEQNELFAKVEALKAIRRQSENERLAQMNKGVQALVEYVTSQKDGAYVIAPQTFKSTAVGFEAGGAEFKGADGHTYRVHVLMRDVATIPPSEKKAKATPAATKLDAILAALQADIVADDTAEDDEPVLVA